MAALWTAQGRASGRGLGGGVWSRSAEGHPQKDVPLPCGGQVTPSSFAPSQTVISGPQGLVLASGAIVTPAT